VRQPTPPPTAAQRRQRDPAGRNNDLSSPQMGSLGSPFGRNVPVDRNQPDVPDPRDVSDLLLARECFIPEPSLNMLAAAWIQFQVHDWANHRRHPVTERSIELPPRPGRCERALRIGADCGPGNDATHWWDGSEVYGTPPDSEPRCGATKPDSTAPRVENSADLQLDEHGCLPLDPENGIPRTDFREAWWLGLIADPIDLAAVDILRTRRRGVPRYNDFRAHLHMPRFHHFEQLTTDPYSLARLKRAYGSVDEIDTVVGLLAETPPAGFGFSDTAFRLFLRMPGGGTPRPTGCGVLQRHCPDLAAVIGRSKAVFAPW
jgi:hypothetical protein